MFKEIFVFELKQWVKRPGIYIYFGLFLVLSFLIGALIGGLFTGVTSDTNSYINASATVSGILTSFSTDYLLGLITLLICVSLMAGCVQKDFQNNCFSFYFTKPISKFDYLIGRFSASFLLTFFVLTAIIIGIFLAFLVSPNDNGQIGPFSFINFFKPFIIFLVPNAFLIGAIFFSLVTFTRNMTSGYVGSLVFIVVAGISRSITGDIDNKTFSAIIDPFGQQALELVTEYWTPSEVNTRLVPFSSYILYNRLFWVGLALALILFTYFRFSFNQFLNPVSIFKRKSKQSTSQPSKGIQSIGHLPKVTQVFNFKLSWFQTVFLTKFEFSKITKSVFFYIVIALSMLLTVLMLKYSALIYGTVTYPLTYLAIETGSGIFRFFLLILVIFYSGIVIWRERDSKVDELVGASPIGNGVLFISKYLSLVFLCLTVYTVCILTCIAYQAYSGYYKFEIGLYLSELIGLRFLPVLILVGISVSLQVFFKNRYFAYFAVVIFVLGLPLIFNVFGYKNDALSFNSDGAQLKYSDMNGHGHTLINFFIYKFYWLGFVGVIATLAALMFHRGRENAFKTRWKLARKQFRRSYKIAMIVGMISFLGCGSIIIYNTRILNPYKSEKQIEKEAIEFEKKYKKYEKELQPRVVESNLKVDIFPDKLGCEIKGYYFLKNKYKEPIKRIFLNMPADAKRSAYSLSNKYKVFLKDTVNGFYGLELAEALLPNDSLKLEYEVDIFPKKFILNPGRTTVFQNGTFFNSGSVLPSIGYNPDGEIGENSARKKYKLPPKPRAANIHDTTSYAKSCLGGDADWIRLECVVSTKEGQIAVAPGYLQKEWKENNRHYFHYKMNVPILNFYAFLSADYQIKRDKWINPLNKSNKVNIEIYYQKGHEYNIDKMIKGIKKSLDYYTKNFSPYQHQQVRILEFPRYATFAQSFPNTIPFSEGIGFIAKVNKDDPNDIDYPFYVTAHEVAHQWWGHQVIGANCQGAALMMETTSQYSALMVMEKEYGQESMSKFLKYEMNTYLKGRAQENKKEVPLMLCENQQYLHYNKGSMVMYALKDYIGEDSLNAALRRYIKKVAFQEPPYTTALDMYGFIKAATPDSLKETVKDLFERIIVFDNKIKSWTSVKTNDGKFKITAIINCDKTKNDSLGKAKELVPADWIDIGVFSKNEKNQKTLGKAFYFKKMKIGKKEQVIELIVDKEPYMLGIDPYYKLIDKDTGNNIMDKNGKEIGGSPGEESGNTVVVSGGEED